MGRTPAFVFDAYGTLCDVGWEKTSWSFRRTPTASWGRKGDGFQVTWLNRARALADATGIAPDAVLTRLAELPRVFAAA